MHNYINVSSFLPAQPTTPGSSEPGPEPAEAHKWLLWIFIVTQQQSFTRYKLTALQCTTRSVWHPHTHTHMHKSHRTPFLFLDIMPQHSFLYLLVHLPGSANNVQYRTERIKIPSTPRYPRSMLGSDRGIMLTITTHFIGKWMHLLKHTLVELCFSHLYSLNPPTSLALYCHKTMTVFSPLHKVFM